MTKAELIRKIAKRAGVPDSEAKFFFELFLKKIASQLKPGETVKMKGLGYFQLRTGKIRNESIESELMIYYPLSSEQGDTSDNMIFNIPQVNEPKHNPVDALFSLSFGRPVIPLTNANSSEYFLPPTGAELRRLSEAKSEKLLQDIELVRNFSKGNEELILNPDFQNSTQMEIDWEDIQSITKKESDKNSLSWDFGDLDKELEAEAILDSDSDETLIQSYEELEKENLDWNFGDLHEIVSDDEPADEEPQEKIKNFEQVKSITSEFTLNEEEDEWDFANDKIFKKEVSSENQEGFSEIKNRNQKFPFVTDISEENSPDFEELYKAHIDEDDLLLIEKPSPDEKSETEDIYDVVPPPSVIPDRPAAVEPIEPVEAPENVISDTRRKGLGFYVIFSILFLIAAGYYGYQKIFKKPAEVKKIVEYVNSKTAPANVIIERSYEIPVTYPYITSTALSLPFNPYNLPKEDTVTINPSAGEQPEQETVQEQKQTPPVINNKSEQQNNMNSETSQKVKEFIYKKGDRYIVQISAWQNKARAEKHAEILRGQGLATEIQVASLSSGTWYRVRAGYFNTLEEAEKFYNNNR